MQWLCFLKEKLYLASNCVFLSKKLLLLLGDCVSLSKKITYIAVIGTHERE